ncbi:DNA topoisomerase family protein [Aphelenchoides avenae]|nr:DNA topoisomerase family protein [Aphelenchus avenae]
MTHATSKLIGLEELQPEPCDGTGTDAMSKRFHKWHRNVPLEEVILDPTQPIDLAALGLVPCSECPNDPIAKRILAKWKPRVATAPTAATAVQAVKPLPTVLVVAEKRQMARDIAARLSPKGEFRTVTKPTAKKGDRKLEVFTFEADFYDKVVGRTRAKFKVTATHGHLYHFDFTDLAARLGSEASIESADLAFDDTICKRVTNSAVHDFLRDEARGCDFVVLFLDCDLPGENICFQVTDVIEDSIGVPSGGDVMDRTFRAHYSTVNDIEQAMMKLKKPNKDYSDAVEAKHIIDLKLGVAISRFLTAHIRESLEHEFIVPFIHYGPCIAPALALIVQRFKEDRAHEAQKYWRVTWTVERDGRTFDLSNDVDQQPNEEDLRASLLA